MDELLSQLLSFPPFPEDPEMTDAEYDTSMRSLVSALIKTPASLLAGDFPGGNNLLDTLDPHANSVPYLYTLLAHMNATQTRSGKSPINVQLNHIGISPLSPLWSSMVSFLKRFDSKQVRYAGNEFRLLIETVARSARLFGKPLLAIHPIRTAILRLDPSSATFTSTHALFVSLCLQARAFRAAIPVLDKDILGFPSMPPPAGAGLLSSLTESSSTYITVSSGLSDFLKSTDLLEYHLHGAMIYIGLKKWERAIQFLSLVISTPTQNVASAVMVEAYKKWILVCLLYNGITLPIPKSANPSAVKSYRILGKAYERVAELFRAGDLSKLRAEVEAGREVWSSDCNTGLMKLVLAAFPQFSIRNLEKVYSTLSIPQIHQRLHAKIKPTTPNASEIRATEAEILSMIDSGTLNATLAHPASQSTTLSPPAAPTVLHFSPPRISEAAQLAEVEEQIQRTIEVTKHIRGVDRRMENSKEYLTWLARMRMSARKNDEADAGGSGGPGMGGDAMDMDWEEGPAEADEDMMAGVHGGE
ncbi:MAG: hypothetical protein M1837_000238 [Sclerophora amabilis]|nr:MAG: hypothetical protein M1837_000238 [Sclerophora amabilis]